MNWAVIGCDDKGVTIEKTGPSPEELADYVASWAQQEEDKWPEMGLIYMLIPPEDVPAAHALQESTAPSPSPRELLEEAYDLLTDARCALTDPGLARSWGQRKRRFRDAVIERRAAQS